jgi:hypothetical protein
VRCAFSADIPLRLRDIVWIQGFLPGALGLRDVLQVEPDAGPRVKTSPHRIDEHVRFREVRGRLRVPRAPAIKTGHCIVLALRTADLNQRILRLTAPRRLHALGFPRLLPVVRRPRRIAETVAFVPCGELQERRE